MPNRSHPYHQKGSNARPIPSAISTHSQESNTGMPAEKPRIRPHAGNQCHCAQHPPMPKAIVATMMGTSPLVHSACTASRSSGNKLAW